MPHTLASRTPVPFYKDRGIALATLWLAAILAFNLYRGTGQITGLTVAAPFLAATLVERASRVIWVGLAGLVVVVLSAWANDTPWDAAQRVRFGAVIVATVISWLISVSQQRARNRT